MRHTRTVPAGVATIAGYPIPSGAADGDPDPKGQDGDGTDDATDTGTGQAATETDGQDGTAGDGTDGTDGDADDGKPKGRAGGEDALRADLARERKRRREIQAELDAARRTSETETQAREREIREQAQAPAIRALRATAIETAAREAGFVYPEDAFTLLTAAEREEIEVDLEDDTPSADRKAASTLVKALAKRRPALIAPSETDGDDGKAGTGGADTQAGTRSGSGSSSSDPNATVRGLFRQKLGSR